MIHAVRCALSGCFRHRVGANRSFDNFLKYLVNHGWYLGTAKLGGVVVSLCFCPKHNDEGVRVNDSTNDKART